MLKPNSKVFLSLSVIAIMYGIDDSYAQISGQSGATVIAEPNSQQSNQDINLPSTTFDPIVVIGHKDIMQPEISANDVYDKNESSTYKTQEDIERFMGESPSDIFKGMTGVQSGDARNSGAIDPNVRGIQGQGRVPVTIDGTEQAVTVYRGYAGANNRNYIDPLLISDVKVSKGVSMARGVQSSVGGAVTINTLNVNDILQPEQSFGFNIKGSVGNNTTSADAIDYDSDGNIYAGNYGFDVYPEQDLYNPAKEDSPKAKQQAQQRREQFLNLTGDLPRRTFEAGTSKAPATRSNALDGEDTAVRIAVAGRTDFDVGSYNGMVLDGLAAYTYRDRGNYFAGKDGSDDYRSDVPIGKRSTGDFSAYMADVYLPGREVPNTSNNTESYLFKGTLRPNDDQALQLGIRHTETTYGDIMPSRVSGDNRENGLYALTGRLPQWPLSDVELDSYYLQYRYDPADNPWINLHSNFWRTNSTLHTNNSGGYPYISLGILGRKARVGFDDYKQGMVNQFQDTFPEVVNCTESQVRNPDNTTLCGQLSTLYGSNTQVKGDAFMTTYNDRDGVSLSNTASITDDLDVTLSGNWQQEKLWSDPVEDKLGVGFVALPRKGRREAWDVSANFDYRPTDNWQIQAGLTYNRYWAFDDLLNDRRKQGLLRNRSKRITGYELLYYQKANQQVQDMLAVYNLGDISGKEYKDFLKSKYPEAITSTPVIYGNSTNSIENGEAGVAYIQQQYIWQADSEGNFSRDNNPFFNGDAAQKGWLRPAIIKEVTQDNFKGSGQATPINADVTVGDPYKDAKKHEAWAVSPSIAASYQFTPTQRLYARYAQATRMPSLYESTLGFSLQSMDNENQVKPETGTNMEVGYVLDMTDWFSNANYADLKLAYYHNRIDDIIDRTDDFTLKNFDHQTIEGIELQSRYDDGDWFGELSVSHNFKHEVCDAGYAMTQDPYYGQVPECVKYGFSFGYLQNMGQPDWQADLTLGTRLLEDKITLGTRLHYHSGADKEVNANNYGYSNEGTIIFNTPLDWASVLTLDGFMNYKINDHLNFELSGTNLTNQYYIDPLSRTLMPAPGRAVVAKAEVKF